MWKKIGAGIALLLILIAAAGYYLFSNLDSLIKSAIEKYGRQATQTEVTVGHVDLSLNSGSGSITGLTIANPAGYSKPIALSASNIAVKLDTASLAGKGPMIIDSIIITKPQVTYEVKGVGQGSNLQTLQDNIRAFSTSGTSQAAAQSGGPGRKEIIRDLTITDGQVTVLAPTLSSKTIIEPLPPIHLTNLGGSTGGTPAQIGAQVLNTLANEAAAQGAAALINQQLGTKAVSPAAGSLLKNLFGN